MFSLMRLGLHFSQMSYGAMDPLVLEMIRTEQLMREEAAAKMRRGVPEPAWVAPAVPETENEPVRKAA